jgi:hemerythrin-like domain-containing protein
MVDTAKDLPTQVRERILADHAMLRVKIRATRDLAPRAQADPAAFDAFAVAAGELLSALSDHLDLEDEILVPVLGTIDAWGPERAKRLAAEHAEQRELLVRTQVALGSRHRDAGDIVKDMERFILRLEADMALEEKTTLSDELFAAFPIRTDFGGG